MSDLTIEKIKDGILTELEHLSKRRVDLTVELTEDQLPNIEEVKKLFEITNILSDTLKALLTIDHHLTPQMSAALLSVIQGLSNGRGIKEVVEMVEFFTNELKTENKGGVFH